MDCEVSKTKQKANLNYIFGIDENILMVSLFKIRSCYIIPYVVFTVGLCLSLALK